MTAMVDTALQWYHGGVTPIPCRPKTKVPAVSWKRWQTHRPSKNLVDTWFGYDSRNVALMTGTGGLLVLDFDSLPEYYKWKHSFPNLVDTFTVATPRPGRHVYFHCERPTTSMFLDGVEVKGKNSLVMTPPSVHPSGGLYKVYNDAPVLEIDGVSEVVSLLDSVKGEGGLVVGTSEHKRGLFPFTESSVSPRTDLVGRIKACVSILGLLSRYTTPIPSDRYGRWYVMRCPNPEHIDHNPSFWADTIKNRCGCFCPRCKTSYPNRSLDVFNLYGWIHGISNGDAIRALAKSLIE